MNKEQTLEFLSKAADLHASDIFIIAGRPLSIKTDGRLSTYGDRLMPEQTSEILEAIYQMANNRDISRLHNTGDDDFSFSMVYTVLLKVVQSIRYILFLCHLVSLCQTVKFGCCFRIYGYSCYCHNAIFN